MKTVLRAKSSSGDSYEVTVELLGERLIVECSCKAGIFQQQCKHKRSLILGKVEMLFDQGQANLLEQVRSSLEGQQLVKQLQAEEAALAIVEKEKARLAVEEKAIKGRIGKLFTHGSS